MWTRTILQMDGALARVVRGLAVTAFAAAALGACASGGAEAPAAGEAAAGASAVSPEASGETAAVVAEEAAAEAPAAPPAAETARADEDDHEWFEDDLGRPYRVDAYSKSGAHQRLEDGSVRVIGGIPIEVEHEDDEYFYYRVYSIESERQEPEEPTGPSAEELAAAYANHTVEASRLELAEFSTGLPTSGQWRNGFTLADIDGDGHLDIVHSTPRKSFGGPVIFLGDGAGNWRRWQGMTLPPKRYDYGTAAVADLDGDGRPDLVLGMHLIGLAALRNMGDGRFEDWGGGLPYEVPGQGGMGRGFSSRAVAIVDWNRNGLPDIAALGEGPRMSTGAGRDPAESPRPGDIESYGLIIYLNQGDGTWVPLSRGNEFGQNFGDSITVGDFDGDGWPDLATGSNSMGTRGIVHLNRDEGRSWETVELTALRPRTYARSVAAADVDGDGRDELFVGVMSVEGGTWRTGIELFDLEDGVWSRRPLYVESSRDGIWAIATGDLDGDGRPDVAATTGDGRSIILLAGDGGYTLEQPGLEQFPGGCRGYHVAMADLDGDGRDELVEGFAGESNAMMDLLRRGAPPSCPSSGGLRAWDATPREGAEAAAR
jgi:hypothetical protein